jgi:fasciclin domain-containing protein
MTSKTRKLSGLAALALTMSVSLAACGSDDTKSDTGTDTGMKSSETTGGSDQAMDEPFGPACGQVPASGDGSFQGMATAPVASAASANPLLSTLVTAVTAADLVEPLNSADALTVLAPANPAFEAIPAKDLKALLKNKPVLSPGKLSPDQLAGDHDTLAKDTVTISGSGEDFTIDAGNGNTAKVLCGNIQTANATVYVIDSVLMPKM